jgi:hypothetical protein
MSSQPVHAAIAAPAFLLGLFGGLLRGKKGRRPRNNQLIVGSRAEEDFVIVPELLAVRLSFLWIVQSQTRNGHVSSSALLVRQSQV